MPLSTAAPTMDPRQMAMQLAQLQAQMAGVLAELAACKARLDKVDGGSGPTPGGLAAVNVGKRTMATERIGAPASMAGPTPGDTPLKAATRGVEERGNIKVNHENGYVKLVRNLAFQPRTTKDEPTAVFRDVAVADSICKDLAELSSIFGCPVTIEGHTKGGDSDFWQTLANRRAALVADKMVEFGANPELLRTNGLPGRRGKNEVRTEIYMDIRNIKDENAQTQEVDTIQNGRVVERDFVQAGRVVERDAVVSNQVVERDVVGVGGQAVERQQMPIYIPASPQTVLRPAFQSQAYQTIYPTM